MPAGSTYTPIATTTLGSAVRSYTFSSVPSSYTDLILVANGTSASPSDLGIILNGDTGNNYSATQIIGNGSSASSSRESNVGSAKVGTFYSSPIGNLIINIMNYSNSTTYKTILSRNNSPSNYTGAFVSLWRNTATVTSVQFYGNNDNLSAGTTLTLYGVTAA